MSAQFTARARRPSYKKSWDILLLGSPLNPQRRTLMNPAACHKSIYEILLLSPYLCILFKLLPPPSLAATNFFWQKLLTKARKLVNL
ncbi:hypothetical protein [Nostoc sphaeroides]|uniref:hypothetical protein n=1 Tax=Nostoc sphaeroides TaxID=446679 RepID=UPI0011C1B36B|nr:hypothetical protein [Nostoc sphaeroides]MCC5631215.1 hypothetical protein [Nostoc sphaeroides CHAB 2801]